MGSVESPRALLAMAAAAAVVIVLALLACMGPAPAVWSPQLAAEWGDLPDMVKSWFKSVRSPNGVPCCDVSDGHRTDYEIRSVAAPGESVVWYVQQAGPRVYYIRCFVSGGGV